MKKVTGSQQTSQPVQKQGTRYPRSDREQALEMILQGKSRKEVAKRIGASQETIRRWVIKARQEGIHPRRPDAAEELPEKAELDLTDPADDEIRLPKSTAPHDPGYGLSETEVGAILKWKREYPSMGPAQIRAQLKRFKGWRLSVKAIGRTLQKNGYELEQRGSRPQGYEPQRFEAPHRNNLWQLDFMEARIYGQKLFILVILDDFSRYLVALKVLLEPTSEAVVEVMKESIRLHGKPEGTYTDRGGAFLAWRDQSSFSGYCEEKLIDHHVSKAYHPQGRGKVEAVIRTLQRELWEIEHLNDLGEVQAALDKFRNRYNFERAHMGIDGLTPADRYFGRWPEVLDRINAISRQRNGADTGGVGLVQEEALAGRAPVEVLRLMINDNKLELRFFGHRVVLGEIHK
jgi:transposase InsO family protein